MANTVVKITDVKNPCKGVCKFDPVHDVCIACYRTETERARWSRYLTEEKVATVKLTDIRRTLLGPLQPKEEHPNKKELTEEEFRQLYDEYGG